MKNKKLLTLSCFSFLALAGLASCAGGRDYPTEPDVYFRANSRIIENVDGQKVVKQVDFKNSECAKIEIEGGKDNLKYGEKDVVITITPKLHFTFREYDIESWQPIEPGTAIRPYVGLGSPHSLYSYKLQENVAWTFKDLSTPSTKSPGFYAEKYQITVKKEAFQKNIVIDYGNVLDNGIYVHNSALYSKLFTEKSSLSGDFADLYELNKNYSGFVAASEGATVTYSLKNQNSPFSFTGWAADPVKPNSTNEKIAYPNFEIYGINTKDKTRENIALYEEGVKADDQKFSPTVLDDGKSISFFINWELLANNDADYSMKFDKIEVNLKEPTIDCKMKPHFDDGIKVYPCDFFQHENESHKLPFNTDGTLQSYDPSKTGEEARLDFANIFFDAQKLQEGSAVQYSTIFQLFDDETTQHDSRYFSVTINEETVSIDLVNGTHQMTNYHEALEEITGEKELPYWEINTGRGRWYLMQLNPAARTYGIPEQFRTKEGVGNLYYLYTIESLPSEVSIDVAYAEIPKFTEFKLSATTFGTFVGGSDTISLPCAGKTSVEIPFARKDEYRTTTFEVSFTGEGTENIKGIYKPNTSIYGVATILIESVGVATIPEGEITIKLTQLPTSVVLAGDTLAVGRFFDPETHELLETCEPTISDDRKTATFFFQFNTEYIKPLSEYKTNSPFDRVLFNGSAPTECKCEEQVEGSGLYKFTVTVDSEIPDNGAVFELNMLYANINFVADSTIPGEMFVLAYKRIGEAIFNGDRHIEYQIAVEGVTEGLQADIDKSVATVSVKTTTTGTVWALSVDFAKPIQNGTLLTVTLFLGK